MNKLEKLLCRYQMEMKIIVGLYLPPGIVVLDLLVKMCHFGPINEFEKCVYRSAGYS